MTDVLGPANAANAVTTRIAESRVFPTGDTWFKPCSTPASQDGTQIQSVFLNGLMAQLRAAIRGNGKKIDGVTPIIVEDNTNDAMLLGAILQLIQRGQATYASDTGTADALVITPSPAVAELKPGMRFFVGKNSLVNANATTVPTIAVSGLPPVTIVKADASALGIGDLKKGVGFEIEFDGTSARLVSLMAPSDAKASATTLLQQFVIIADQKPNLTPGGVFTKGAWRTRDLNTVLADPQGLTSGTSPTIGLASNQVTLQSGTYIIQGSSPALTGDTHKTRFQNVTDGTTTIWGTSENGTGNISQTPDSVQTRSQFIGTIVLTAAKTFQIQHICATTSTGDLNGTGNTGFGCPATYNNNPVTDGVETYTLLTITKVG